MKTEIAPLLIVTKLEQYDYAGATAIAVVDAGRPRFLLLLLINLAAVLEPSGATRPDGNDRHGSARHRTAAPARVATRDLERPAVRWLLIGRRAGVPRPVPAAAAGARVRRGAAAGVGALSGCAASSRTRCAAIRLTLLTAAIAVPLNLVFGLAAAWAIAKFEFPGKSLLDHADRSAVLGLAGDRRA